MGFGKDKKGVIIRHRVDESLGALADRFSEILADEKLALEEDFRMINLEIAGSIEMVSDAGVHGSLLGIANGALSTTEIVECIAAQGPLGPSDRQRSENAERFVKILGSFAVNGNGALESSLIGPDGGPFFRKNIRWTFTNTDGWNLFVFNNTGVTMGSGNIVNLVITYFGVWLV